MGIQVQPCCCPEDDCGCECTDYYDDFSGALSGDWTEVLPAVLVSGFGTPVWETSGGHLVQSDPDSAGELDLNELELAGPNPCASIIMGIPGGVDQSVATQWVLRGTGHALVIDFRCGTGSNIHYTITESGAGGFGSTGSIDTGIPFDGEFKVAWKILPGGTLRICLDDEIYLELSLSLSFVAGDSFSLAVGSHREAYWDDVCINLDP